MALVHRGEGYLTAAREITAAIDAYVASYSVPLVDAARRGEPAASSDAGSSRAACFGSYGSLR